MDACSIGCPCFPYSFEWGISVNATRTLSRLIFDELKTVYKDFRFLLAVASSMQ